MVIGALLGHIGEKVDYRVDLAFAQQVETVPVDGGQQGIEVAGPAELIDRFGVALALQQPAGRLLMQPVQAIRIALAQSLVEGLAQ